MDDSKNENFDAFGGKRVKNDSSHLIFDLWTKQQHSSSLEQKIIKIIETHFFLLKENDELTYVLRVHGEGNLVHIDILVRWPNFDFSKMMKDIETNIPFDNSFHRTFRRGNYALSWLSRWDSSEKGLLIVTFVVAMCSLLYELILAQTLSSVLGDTAHRYNITIGLYIASMGLGALFYEKLNVKNFFFCFVAIETSLALIGGLAPSFSLIWDNWWRGSSWIIALGLHFMVFLIGFLSGLELPLLMEWGEKKRKGLGNYILAIDYAGSLFAAILFPLVLLFFFPLFGLSAIVASVNAFVAFVMGVKLLRARTSNEKILMLSSALTLVLFLLLTLNTQGFTRWLVQTFYIAGAD